MTKPKATPNKLPEYTACAPDNVGAWFPLPGMRPPGEVPDWDCTWPIVGVTGMKNLFVFDRGDMLFADSPEFIGEADGTWRHVASRKKFADEDEALAFAASINDKRGGRVR